MELEVNTFSHYSLLEGEQKMIASMFEELIRCLGERADKYNSFSFEMYDLSGGSCSLYQYDIWINDDSIMGGDFRRDEFDKAEDLKATTKCFSALERKIGGKIKDLKCRYTRGTWGDVIITHV